MNDPDHKLLRTVQISSSFIMMALQVDLFTNFGMSLWSTYKYYA